MYQAHKNRNRDNICFGYHSVQLHILESAANHTIAFYGDPRIALKETHYFRCLVDLPAAELPLLLLPVIPHRRTCLPLLLLLLHPLRLLYPLRWLRNNFGILTRPSAAHTRPLLTIWCGPTHRGVDASCQGRF
jgi:hypothetical protein